MKQWQTTEKRPPPVPAMCPHLPVPVGEMSYRDLRDVPEGDERERVLFEIACRYANYLWKEGLPARAILALCRALYLDPSRLPDDLRQPWDAYVWFIRHDPGTGFTGNPRISFIHQATRIGHSHPLKRHRAWALWLLTRTYRPDFPPDPQVHEEPPPVETLVGYLNENGLPAEGTGLFRLLQGQ